MLHLFKVVRVKNLEWHLTLCWCLFYWISLFIGLHITLVPFKFPPLKKPDVVLVFLLTIIYMYLFLGYPKSYQLDPRTTSLIVLMSLFDDFENNFICLVGSQAFPSTSRMLQNPQRIDQNENKKDFEKLLCRILFLIEFSELFLIFMIKG